MILFLCAQDLRQFRIGLVCENGFVSIMEEHLTAPETYLSVIDQFLTRQHQTLESLTGVSVVTGPGSFTSTRIIVTIANTFLFTKKIPLYILRNPDRLSTDLLLQKYCLGNRLSHGEYACATYERPAHITQPRGDK